MFHNYLVMNHHLVYLHNLNMKNYNLLHLYFLGTIQNNLNHQDFKDRLAAARPIAQYRNILRTKLGMTHAQAQLVPDRAACVDLLLAQSPFFP